jgi:hypothetical protein
MPPRSGRGGRRFKSCHSDQYLADIQIRHATPCAAEVLPRTGAAGRVSKARALRGHCKDNACGRCPPAHEPGARKRHVGLSARGGHILMSPWVQELQELQELALLIPLTQFLQFLHPHGEWVDLPAVGVTAGAFPGLDRLPDCALLVGVVDLPSSKRALIRCLSNVARPGRRKRPPRRRISPNEAVARSGVPLLRQFTQRTLSQQSRASCDPKPPTCVAFFPKAVDTVNIPDQTV